MLQKQSSALVTFLFCSMFYSAGAQNTSEALNTNTIAITIDSIGSKLQQLYVYPEVAKKMTQYLESNFQSKRYDSIADPIALANRLTTDLQFISKDKHLRVYYDPKEIAEAKNEISESERKTRQKERIKLMQKQKFGFEQIKMLDGRIGYLDLRSFMETQFAAEAAHKAMNRIINLDAIVIDLRENIGGSPSMIQLLSSYFFSSDSVHLNKFYFRQTDEFTETWTQPTLPKKRRPDIDLYILTSKRTFSAAEEFAYNFKNLKRATIIGETTAGGAHPGGPISATDQFRIWMPQGRAINPITKTNWEGTGVKPDIEVPADEALMVAQLKALNKLLESATNSAISNSYRLSIEDLKKKLKIQVTKYADILVDAVYKKWNDKYETFYGGRAFDGKVGPSGYINPKVVLGNNYNYVSIPKDSYITLQFTDNLVIDAPNRDDIFIEEMDGAGDRASIYVSSDGKNYKFLGVANGGTTNSMDLADINFEGVVSYIRIKGLDLNGASPGFDLVRVYGLPGANIDKYVPGNETEKYLKDTMDYQRRILLKPVEFEFESFSLLPKGKAYLDKLFKSISENPSLKFKIIGHTDNIGTVEFNDQLSEKRAKSIYDYFIKKGMRAASLSYEGRGNREPLSHNETEEGRKRNRRVELMKVED